MKKDVVLASKALPAQVRKSFVRAFRATGAMDLYGGRLEDYFSVIAQEIETRGRRIKGLERNRERARSILFAKDSP